MTEAGTVQIVSLVGCLILAARAFASYRLQWAESVRMALVWAGIFTAVALLFSLVMA